MYITTRTLTQDGLEMQVGTNHLGHFHLTNCLLDCLEQTAEKTNDARIVNVASLAHTFLFGKIDWSNFNSEKSYDFTKAYSVSKLANIYHAKYLSLNKKKTLNEKLKFVSLHPGVVDTEIVRNLTEYRLVSFLYVFI